MYVLLFLDVVYTCKSSSSKLSYRRRCVMHRRSRLARLARGFTVDLAQISSSSGGRASSSASAAAGGGWGKGRMRTLRRSILGKAARLVHLFNC